MSTPNPSALPADAEEQKKAEERIGLIEHFKTVYAIIAGLAITDAAEYGLPQSRYDLVQPQFLMFCTLFVTIIPIFHGVDRSLVIRHGKEGAKTGEERASYVLDVFMLLITALMFVGMARTIKLGPTWHFYFWMTITMLFDVFTLQFDLYKMRRWLNKDPTAELKKAYRGWSTCNTLLLLVCLVCYLSATATTVNFYWASVIFIAALLRTIFDYRCGGDFMFP